LIPVGFGYEDGDEFFMGRWVWDNETRPRPAPLPSLAVTRRGDNFGFILANFLISTSKRRN